LLDEQQRRLYAGLESLKLGRGGDRQLSDFLGLAPHTVARGRQQLLAQDVEVDRVRIEADLSDPDAHVTFTHNGGAFSAENIRFLIEQVSSKSRPKGRTGRPTTTGKFGTGFLTTHLFSPYVLVTGVAKQQGLLARKFELFLDRSGTELDEIIAAVEAAKKSIQELDQQPHYKGYVAGNFNTAFRYDLADDTGKHVARAGLSDLDTCLPYTLAFVGEIESVEYPNHLVSLEELDEEKVDGEVQCQLSDFLGLAPHTASSSSSATSSPAW